MTTQQIAKYFSKKMYEFAGADAGRDSHDKIEWTPEQVFAYRSWLIDYLKSHKTVRRLAMKDSSKDKIESFVDNWIKHYGFKLQLLDNAEDEKK